MTLFPGFKTEFANVNGVSIRYKIGGHGPPLLLLHGNPQSHMLWHQVASALSSNFTVVCSDLRGYGMSSKPHVTPEQRGNSDTHPYSKRNMAVDQASLMTYLGFDKFYAAGHDRGGRTLHRLLLDYPERVIKAAVLDIVPTIEVWEKMTWQHGMGYHHWLFLAQPPPMPETLISAVDAGSFWFLDHCTWNQGHTLPPFFHKEAVQDYLDCFTQHDGVRGMCEDYRAAATVDVDLDRESRAKGVKIKCPLLVLWGKKGRVNEWYAPVEVWQGYVEQGVEVQGAVMESGHYVPEEDAKGTIEQFLKFFV